MAMRSPELTAIRKAVIVVLLLLLGGIGGWGCDAGDVSLGETTGLPPEIHSVQPDSGTFGSEVRIEGRNFGTAGEGVTVTFNGLIAEVAEVTPQAIRVRVPKSARSGPVEVNVGEHTASGPLFRYVPKVSVTTRAGSGEEGYRDGHIDEARFNEPWGIETSETGELFVTDFQNSVIRKVHRDNRVTTFATGFLDHPMGLALGVNGEIYTADAFNNMVQTVSLDGEVSHFAGSGFTGAQDGDKEVASFNLPADIAVRQSDLTIYVADAYNNKIRVIRPAGVVSTLAGSRKAGFRDGIGTGARFRTPAGLALGPDEATLYVADFLNHSIRAVDLSTGEVRTLAGDGMAGYHDGPLGEARFRRPIGITVDARGILYVADTGNHCLRMIEDGKVTTLAGKPVPGYEDGDGSRAQFNEPYHIVISRTGGRVMYVSDRRNNVIRKVLIE